MRFIRQFFHKFLLYRAFSATCQPTFSHSFSCFLFRWSGSQKSTLILYPNISVKVARKPPHNYFSHLLPLTRRVFLLAFAHGVQCFCGFPVFFSTSTSCLQISQIIIGILSLPALFKISLAFKIVMNPPLAGSRLKRISAKIALFRMVHFSFIAFDLAPD